MDVKTTFKAATKHNKSFLKKHKMVVKLIYRTGFDVSKYVSESRIIFTADSHIDLPLNCIQVYGSTSKK